MGRNKSPATGGKLNASIAPMAPSNPNSGIADPSPRTGPLYNG